MSDPAAFQGPSPFHAGEQAAQTRAGVRDAIEAMGRRIVRDFMPDPHRELFGKLPFVVLGTLDVRGRPWASTRFGPPGFMTTPDARTVSIASGPLAGDPAGPTFVLGAPVGMLGIQLQTRRRNRMNGTVVDAGPSALTLRVGQSFGNCPKYIQARTPRFLSDPSEPSPPRSEGPILSEASAALVRRADTFFIASASARAREGGGADGMDVSHRGGRPGFLRVTEAPEGTLLEWPDFVGNYLFNTLGNLAVYPHAGLLFVDFDTGSLLSLTCDVVDVAWDGPDVSAFRGAERIVRVRVVEGVAIDNALPLRWSDVEPAREIAGTGEWRG